MRNIPGNPADSYLGKEIGESLPGSGDNQLSLPPERGPVVIASWQVLVQQPLVFFTTTTSPVINPGSSLVGGLDENTASPPGPGGAAQPAWPANLF